MKRTHQLICKGFMPMLLVLAFAGLCHGQLVSGQAAPLFSLKDTQGKVFELVSVKDQPMIIIYFFDVNSRPSQEGLLHLVELSKNYKDSDLIVWGVTRSDAEQVSRFLSQTKLAFPVLMDKGSVSDAYAAKMILPTVCIIGPDLKLLDYFQGGGKNTEAMLVALAEREMQRRNTQVARAISDQVVKINPKNVRATSVKGYAELKEGDLKAAEKTFYNLSRSQGEGEVAGKEGLSQVYAQKGEPTKAVQLAKEVEQKGGQRSQTHVVQGDLLYSQDKPAEAEKEYRKAISATGSQEAYKAVAYNQLGRIYALSGKYSQSREMYDQAVSLDPYYVEATSNKGMTFEKQGEWAKALESYRRAQTINKDDPFAAALSAHAQKMMLLDKDPERRQRFESQIENYVRRYKEDSREQAQTPKDPWTSGPMILTLIEPSESGGLSKRDGFGRVLTLQVAEQLNASGRVQVIEPVMVERVLEKLGLKQKDLADPDTQYRLARAFGASVIGRGTLFHLIEGTLLNLKLADVDNPQKARLVERQFASAVTLKKDLHWLNREVLTSIISEYPLQAYIVEVTGNQVLLNLGADQGVVTGTLFDVIEEKSPVNYKGKEFKPEPSVLATVEVVKVDPDFAYAHIKEQRRPLQADDKLRESLLNMTGDERKIW